MYEVELRALVDDFDAVKSKLDSFAVMKKEGQREATIFFLALDGHHIRLRMRENRSILGFKEGISEGARKEIETDVSDPAATYKILRELGFEVDMIVARTKFLYECDCFEILLNRIVDWGDAVEVEITVADRDKGADAEKRIREFMAERLGVDELLGNDELSELNRKYKEKIDFSSVDIDDLLAYVRGEKDIGFVK